MKDINNLFFGCLQLVVTVYLYLAILVFVPLYNWQYANQNGAVKWLLLGEVVATFKALVFPYYLINPVSSNKKILDVNSQQFYLAIEISQKATKLINEGGAGIVKQEELGGILNYQKQALEVGRKVSINELDKKHYSLGSNFENKFLKGITLYLEGMETVNTNTALKGQTLMSQWDDWYIANMVQIKKEL